MGPPGCNFCRDVEWDLIVASQYFESIQFSPHANGFVRLSSQLQIGKAAENLRNISGDLTSRE